MNFSNNDANTSSSLDRALLLQQFQAAARGKTNVTSAAALSFPSSSAATTTGALLAQAAATTGFPTFARGDVTGASSGHLPFTGNPRAALPPSSFSATAATRDMLCRPGAMDSHQQQQQQWLEASLLSQREARTPYFAADNTDNDDAAEMDDLQVLRHMRLLQLQHQQRHQQDQQLLSSLELSSSSNSSNTNTTSTSIEQEYLRQLVVLQQEQQQLELARQDMELQFLQAQEQLQQQQRDLLRLIALLPQNQAPAPTNPQKHPDAPLRTPQDLAMSSQRANRRHTVTMTTNSNVTRTSPTTRIRIDWDALAREARPLLEPRHRSLVSDSTFFCLAQMKPCQLTHQDRVGLCKTKPIGFPGLKCQWCIGSAVPAFGKYFPGSLNSFVSGGICKSIRTHLMEECRECPAVVQQQLVMLEEDEALSSSSSHAASTAKTKMGSRRQFFVHIWNQLHQDDPAKLSNGGEDEEGVEEEEKGQTEPLSACNRSSGLESSKSDGVVAISSFWNKILDDGKVVVLSDRHLVSDSIFASVAQTKACRVTEADRIGRCKDHELGSMGLCCKHCNGKPGSFGRYFPSNLHTFSQVEVCKQIVKHMIFKCTMIPTDIRNALMDMQAEETSTPAIRYPSRMVFFRRVWHRFHYGENPGSSSSVHLVDGDDSAIINEDGCDFVSDTRSQQDIPWERLVADSPLVTMEDYGLVLDSQFAAMAQMDRCSLQEEDQMGYNKDKYVGFIGLCCRYCGGRPNFGRFFPNTERNLEKTSSRDTIVSHISLFCKQVPDDVKNALLGLKRIESSKDGSATMKKLIYGSAKQFFHRVWLRLHELEDSSMMERKPVRARKIKNVVTALANTVHPLEAVFSLLATSKQPICFGRRKVAPPRPFQLPTVATQKQPTSDHASACTSSSGESVYSDDDYMPDGGSHLAPTRATTIVKRTAATATLDNTKNDSMPRLVKKARRD